MKLLLVFIFTLCLSFVLTYLYLLTIPTKTEISIKLPTLTAIPVEYNPDLPPKNSLIGEIASPSGEIFWISRTATQPAMLKDISQIKQGEILITKNASQVSVLFPNSVELKLEENSQLEFVQTLPQNLVLIQKTGRVIYQQNSAVLSLKTFHLLTNIEGEKVVVTVDDVKKIVFLDIYSGKITLAYNDLNFNSKTQVVTSGARVIFTDDNRKINFKNIPVEE